MKQTLTILLTILTCFITTFVYPQIKWKTFNHKNGFTIQLPSYFSTGLLVASGTLQWFDNSVNKEIELTVETFGNGMPGSLKNEFDNERSSFTKVTYKVLKPTWYVISGEDERGISYLKTILKNGVLHHLRISYPKTEKVLMDSLIPTISTSFK